MSLDAEELRIVVGEADGDVDAQAFMGLDTFGPQSINPASIRYWSI